MDARETPGAPAPVTATSVDPIYNQPYVEIDEHRDGPEPHRYVHGGFRGTDARFSFYFPPAERYAGRFFQHTYPLAATSDVGPLPIPFHIAQGDLGLCFASGGYYVQSNNGGADRTADTDPTISAYRVNAAAAKHSRRLAAEIYGPHRTFGYLYGGSGGAYQTIGGAENTEGVWDGFIPFVMASPYAAPALMSASLHALRILRRRDRFPGIMDAIEPGGSGDPYAALDAEEAAALRELTRLGFPLQAWWDHATMNSGYLSTVAGLVPALDPAYVEDFWSRPGYLGADPNGPLRGERFRFETTVTQGGVDSVKLESVPGRDYADAHLVVLSGPMAGRSLPIAMADGRTARFQLSVGGFAVSADPETVRALTPGDRVRIDNGWPLALQTYHRHQIPPEPAAGWDQFRDASGQPAYPQRKVLAGPVNAIGNIGAMPTGRIRGKMLAIQSLWDTGATPWQADWYRAKVKAALGPAFEDNYALWYTDHAQHDTPSAKAALSRTISYQGELEQALRDIVAWVERGGRPTHTNYRIEDAQVIVPADAAARGGVQPVVTLTANGAARAAVKVGEPVSFEAWIETPPGAGQVIAAQWDFEGAGEFADEEAIAPAPGVTLRRAHAYATPGVRFAGLRGISQRDGDAKTRFGRIQNLGRVRVVVR
jgi:hypothetical protein